MPRDLAAAAAEARSDVDVVEVVARATWAKAHDGAECPPTRIPAPEDLGAWMSTCPAALQREAEQDLSAVVARENQTRWLQMVSIDPQNSKEVSLVAAVVPSAANRRLRPKDFLTVVEVHAAWLAADSRGRHPLACLVDAWQRLVPERGRIADKNVQIVPRSLAMVERDAASYYLPRFGEAVHQEPSGQLLMGFATEGERGPTLPAEVWTMGMADAEKRGSVIALPFRMWIASVVHVAMKDRHGDYPIALEGPSEDDPLTLRRFLSWVYDLRTNARTGRTEVPGPSKYWDRLIEAIDLVNAHETPFERNRHLWLRRVVTVDKPGEYNLALLDDPWGVTVWLPPGDGTGPRIRLVRLQRWWRNNGGDAACVRALINLSYRWHVEGKRLHPAGGKNKPGRPWLYRRDPLVYDKLTDADKDAICYPAGTGKARQDMRLKDADLVFEKLVREGDAVWHNGRLMPPETGQPSLDHWPRT